jgi:putative membrane protein
VAAPFEIHPFVNALLNATALIAILIGRAAIKRGDKVAHQKAMTAAMGVSMVFLISYLIRMALTGTHKYPGEGWHKTLYLAVLLSHMILAVVIVPLNLRALYLALKQRFAEHRVVVQWAWPVWVYVSTTGVIVYVMLYHLATRL